MLIQDGRVIDVAKPSGPIIIIRHESVYKEDLFIFHLPTLVTLIWEGKNHFTISKCSKYYINIDNFLHITSVCEVKDCFVLYLIHLEEDTIVEK